VRNVFKANVFREFAVRRPHLYKFDYLLSHGAGGYICDRSLSRYFLFNFSVSQTNTSDMVVNTH
jgi:hypothetical protein